MATTLLIYVDSVNANLVCCICQNPFIDPTSTTTCGHTFCRLCILEALSHIAQCPVDRSKLSSDELRPAHAIIRNLVDELRVECPNRTQGCSETPLRHTVTIHARDLCDYANISCPNNKCNSKILRKDLQTHQATCSQRAIICPACLQPVSFSETEAHAEKCPQTTEVCSDCEAEMPKSEIARHSEECTMAAVSCTLASYGCPWVGIRGDLRTIHSSACPYEAIKGFLTLHSKEMITVKAENAALREEMHEIRATLQQLEHDMAKAKHSLGPWFKSSPGPAPMIPSSSLNTIPASRRRRSSPLTNGMLAFDDTTSDIHSIEDTSITNTDQDTTPLSRSLPSMNPSSLAAPSIFQDFARSQPQSPIPPVDVETTLEGSLWSLRNSVVTLSASLDSLSRRQDMNFTTEMLRMHEEVGSLRAIVHGLRMQVHTFMMERNNSLFTGGIGYTQFGSDSSTVQYLNHSPPPSTVMNIAGTVTHRRVAENKL